MILFIILILLQASILMVWFKGACFPCKVFQLLRASGFKKNDPSFWTTIETDETQPENWSRDEFDVWAIMNLNVGVFGFTIGKLITCSVCLSVHLAWVTALISSVICKDILFGLSILSASPYLSNLLLSLLNEK